MFILTVFEILLFEDRWVLALSQQGTESERVKDCLRLITILMLDEFSKFIFIKSIATLSFIL